MRSSAAVVLALTLAAGARAEVIERILAIVEGAPVLLSEVQVVERLRGVERSAALEAVIDEHLMFREAARLSHTALTAEDEEHAFAAVRASVGVAGNETELRRLAHRQATILRYVELRFGAQVRVDDEAVRKEWDSRNPGAPMGAADADEVRQRLAAKDLDERIEAWVRELRAGAEVRYNP
jgi:hypothetical protein